METFLNIVCLLIVVSSFSWWHRRAAPADPRLRGRRKYFLELITLSIALALFLPAISITDDLHAELAVMEDSSSRRKSASIGVAHGPLHHGKFSSPPALLPHSFAPYAFLPRLENLSSGDSFLIFSTLARVPSDRAPPSL